MHLGSCPKEIESSLDLWVGVGGRMGGGGVKGIVPFYNVIRKFVLCKEGTKCENHFNFEK